MKNWPPRSTTKNNHSISQPMKKTGRPAFFKSPIVQEIASIIGLYLIMLICCLSVAWSINNYYLPDPVQVAQSSDK